MHIMSSLYSAVDADVSKRVEETSCFKYLLNQERAGSIESCRDAGGLTIHTELPRSPLRDTSNVIAHQQRLEWKFLATSFKPESNACNSLFSLEPPKMGTQTMMVHLESIASNFWTVVETCLHSHAKSL